MNLSSSDEQGFATMLNRYGDQIRETVAPPGRPPATENELAERQRRREEFGRRFRRLREVRGLSTAAVSRMSGIGSARKLSQYENSCYPPGWVVRALAPIYMINERELALLVLSYSDPDLHAALIAPDTQHDAEQTPANEEGKTT